MHKPYMDYLGKVGKFRAYKVSGAWIRKNEEIEFTNFGAHSDFPNLIPKGELWLDVEYTPNEQSLFLGRMLVEDEVSRQGHGKDSYKVAKKLEEYWRGHSPEVKEVRRSLWKFLDGFQVWIVDGKAVRDQYYVDWTEGGHNWRYSFIPEGEVWIDNDLPLEERDDVLAHEMSEIVFMRDLKMGYGPAHRRAGLVEGVRRLVVE